MKTWQKPPYAIWLGGPWNGLPIKAPGERGPEWKPSSDTPLTEDLRSALKIVRDERELGRVGRYLWVGQSRSGCPYYCWTGTDEQPDPFEILTSVGERFGQDGLQLLLELSEGLGLERAEQAVRRLL